MPLLGQNMEQAKAAGAGGTFTYSRTRMNNLAASEYTLVTIVDDVSGSTANFTKEMEDANGSIVEACRSSPRADNLLMRHLVFGTRVFDDTQRGHGWKALPDINPGDYAGTLAPDDLTALFDGTMNAVEVTISQGDDMRKSGYDVNACIFVKTDGLNNSSTATAKMIAAAIQRARQNETLQSFLMVLIGVNVGNPTIDKALADFAKEAGFDQYVPLADAKPDTLKKLANFVSKSISSSSQALATKGPSKPINPASAGLTTTPNASITI
jgi:hypothetical protein